MTAPHPPCMAPDGAEPCVQYRELVEALAASEARERMLISALVTAKNTIRAWHKVHFPAALRERQWELYQNSPEMTAINAALPDAPSPTAGDAA